MRLLSGLFILLLIASCSSSKHNEKLNGTWVPIEQEIGGAQLPQAAFDNQTLIIDNGIYTMTAESVDKGTVTIKGEKIDIMGKQGPNAGKLFKAIYKLENDQLTICYNLNGDSYPESFSTQGNPMFFMAAFRKQ